MKLSIKSVLFVIAVLIVFGCMAQNDPTVIRIHELVGDTVDLQEKVKFDVFPQIKRNRFQYAVCLLKNDEMTLYVSYTDATFNEVPYSTEQMLEDIDRIYLNEHSEALIPESEYKKALFMVTSTTTHHSIKLKKGKGIELQLKGENVRFRARIKRIIVDNGRAILVRREYGNDMVIPLTDIDFIYRYRKLENWTYKGIGGLFAVTGVIALIVDPSENYALGSVFLGAGAVPFFFPNEKIRMSESRVETVYK